MSTAQAWGVDSHALQDVGGHQLIELRVQVLLGIHLAHPRHSPVSFRICTCQSQRLQCPHEMPGYEWLQSVSSTRSGWHQAKVPGCACLGRASTAGCASRKNLARLSGDVQVQGPLAGCLCRSPGSSLQLASLSDAPLSHTSKDYPATSGTIDDCQIGIYLAAGSSSPSSVTSFSKLSARLFISDTAFSLSFCTPSKSL